MKRLVILGAGTAGTILANRVQARLPRDWEVTVVEPAANHLYQPGLLLLPFGDIDELSLRRPREHTLDAQIEWRQSEVQSVLPALRKVVLADSELDYDLLVIASGARVRPDLTPGLARERGHFDVCDFYTLEGARTLRDTLDVFNEGRLIVDVVEAPIKGPLAPLEFLFIADDHFRRRGIRDRVELVYATPLEDAYGGPLGAAPFTELLVAKGIELVPGFAAEDVDRARHKLRAKDGRALAYDLLVPVPTHSGAAFVERSGIGDARGFVPTESGTLRASRIEDAWVLGDATDLPSAKAGSVAHLQAEFLAEALLAQMRGSHSAAALDARGTCFVDTGEGRGMLLDFGEAETRPGSYPLPGIGPFTFLRPSRRNHWGKNAVRGLYWDTVLRGKGMPLPKRLRSRPERQAGTKGARSRTS